MSPHTAMPAVPARTQVLSAVAAAWTFIRRRLLLVIAVSIATQGVYAWAVLPLLLTLFQSALKIAGVDGLSQANLPGLLGHPTALLALVLVLLVATFFALLEICVFTVVAELCLQAEAPSLRAILGGLARIWRRAVGWQITLFAGYALLVVPLSHIGAWSAPTSHTAIPRFISGEITKTLLGAVAYFVLIAVLVYLGLRLAATAAALSGGAENVLGAMRQSMALTKRTQSFVALVFLSVGAAAAVVFTGAALLGALPVSLAAIGGAGNAAGGTMLAILGIVRFLGTGIAVAFLAFFFVALHRGEGPAVPQGAPVRDSWSRVAASLVLVLFAFLAIPPTVFATLAADQATEQPLVIAHRGYVAGGVENTLESLRAAAAAGADMVETDIQETSDQGFVVIHDVNLQRLAADPRNVYELTAAELSGITVRQDGFSGRIPTLEQYLADADKLGIRVLVEVKPHGHEAPGFARRVVDAMARLDPERQHMVQSLDAGIVDEIAADDPDRPVVLVTDFQIGNVPSTAADAVAIEDWSYSDGMLVRLHDEGKQLFVWTINDPALIGTYIARGVDGIITDRVAEAITAREIQENITNPVSLYLSNAIRQIQP